MTRAMVVLAGCLWASSTMAQAQTYRSSPAAEASPFVEQTDAGAACPSCQVLLLAEVYPAPAHLDVYGPAVPIHRKPTADVLIYDGATGAALLVVTSPYGYLQPYAAIGMYERCRWVTLRPGMVWTTGDLDGDGRSDLIGHDKRTGEIVRVYRRGE